MLAYVTITAALVFFLLWRLGVLDELNRAARGGRGKRWKVEKSRAKPVRSPKPKREDRLDVFQEFIEKLPDEDDPKPGG